VKILHVSSVKIDYSGGTEKVIWELARRQKRKHEVTILQTNLYEESQTFEKESYMKGVRIITCKNDYFLGGFGYSREFKKKLKEIWKEFDIVHIHGHGRFTSNFSLKFLHWKKPIIYTAHGFFHSKKNGFIKNLYDALLGRRLENANFCTGLTPLEERAYLGLGVDKKKIKIIPNGIDLKMFEGITGKEINQFRKKFKSNRKILLYVGRIHQSKGLQNVFRAIKDIELSFLLVGRDAGYQKELEILAKKLNIEDKISFLGKVGDKTLSKLYKIADLFVLFSEWEGFGLVILEAMAAGCPVVGSHKGALPFLIKNNFNGFVANNESELTLRIKTLLEDPKLRKRLGTNALKFVKDFDWAKISNEFLKVYLEASKNG
jgi:glycosyltransferase involved in cell wall biosynthesis